MTVRLWIDAEKNILEFLKSSVRAYIRTHPVGVDDSQGTSYASLIDPSRSALAMCAYPCVGASIARPQQGPPITKRRCIFALIWILRICLGVFHIWGIVLRTADGRPYSETRTP